MERSSKIAARQASEWSRRSGNYKFLFSKMLVSDLFVAGEVVRFNQVNERVLPAHGHATIRANPRRPMRIRTSTHSFSKNSSSDSGEGIAAGLHQCRAEDVPLPPPAKIQPCDRCSTVPPRFLRRPGLVSIHHKAVHAEAQIGQYDRTALSSNQTSRAIRVPAVPREALSEDSCAPVGRPAVPS